MVFHSSFQTPVSASILVVDDDPNSLFGICQILKEEGFHTFSAQSGQGALELFDRYPINLVLTDEKMPDLTGTELLAELRKRNPQVPVILVTAFGSVSMAVEALKRGAYYFFEKPIFNNLERFLTIIHQALKTQEMEREIDELRREVREKYSFPNILGNHPKMLEIFEIIGRVAQSEITVLIQGESGTGKDLIAKTIHYNSDRKEKPLVTINCGALTESLITTELFGHTKGAFTGAVKDTIGRIQAADGGTLILDEIGEIPIQLQKTLLRVIEEKEFEKVGGNRSIKVDVRIISTTNRILEDEVKKGKFREDLFYRLSVVPIRIPPLRERASDIPILVSHFVNKYYKGKTPLRIEPDVMEHLKSYPWPGNVRELANVIQQMVVLCKNQIITMNDLPLHLFSEEVILPKRTGRINLLKMVSDLERKWILRKLEEAEWNQQKAARLLGITRKMLIDRINKYHLRPLHKGRKDNSPSQSEEAS